MKPTKIVNNEPPEGANCFIDGQHFKVGKFDRIFVHRTGEWVFTKAMTFKRLIRETHKQALEEDRDLTFKRHTL